MHYTSDEQIWNLTPRQYDAQMHCAIKFNEMKHNQKSADVPQEDYIDNIQW